jgi:hypothetical protein
MSSDNLSAQHLAQLLFPNGTIFTLQHIVQKRFINIHQYNATRMNIFPEDTFNISVTILIVLDIVFDPLSIF